MTATTTTVRIIPVTRPTELYAHYSGQSQAQDAYIELDLRHGTLLATYNAEIGNAVPFDVFHGFERRFGIPVLTAEAANRVMQELAPLADRVLADWEEVWDGNNMVARLGNDAEAAVEEIEEKLGLNLGYGDWDEDTQGFSDSDVVGQWDLNSASNGDEAEEYDITAETTDERLDEIEADILSNLADCGDNKVNVCRELAGHLQQLRADLIAEAAEAEDGDEG